MFVIRVQGLGFGFFFFPGLAPRRAGTLQHSQSSRYTRLYRMNPIISTASETAEPIFRESPRVDSEMGMHKILLIEEILHHLKSLKS